VPRKRWLIPLGLLGRAMALFLGSILWAVATGVAIPDQDPTPAMVAHAKFHHRIIDALMLAGAVAFLGALLSVPVVLMRARQSRPAPAPPVASSSHAGDS